MGKNMTQGELGKEIGVNNGRICDYERGRKMPSYRKMTLLGFVLSINIWQLFYDKEKKEQENDS
jgi:transcriptional regulator with XRE-family HTH domain